MIDLSIFEARPGLAVLVLPDAPTFTVVAASHDYLKTFGINKDECVGSSHFKLFPKNPNDLNLNVQHNLLRSYEHVVQYEEAHHLPLQRYDVPDGDGIFLEKYWKVSNVPVFNDGGDVSYIIHASEDVTTQVKAERRIESSKGFEKAYNFFMTAPVIIGYVKGEDYVIELANEGLLEVWGRTREVIGKPLVQAIPELKEQGFIQLLDQVCTTGEPFYANEYPITLNRHGKDEVLFMDFVYKPFYENGNDRATGVIAVGHDVTEQVKARQMVKESTHELQLAIEIADLGTFRVDLLRNKATSSAKVNEWFGHSMQEYSREEGFSAIHPQDRARVDAAIDSTLISEQNSRHDVTYRVIHQHDGTIRHLRSFGKTLFNDEGKPYLIIGTIQDITQQVLDQRKLEESEIELQKKVLERTVELENLNHELRRSNTALEQFAYAASHDLKEPIRKISFFAERLKHDLGELSEVQSRLFTRMEHSVKRMNLLIDDLLTYSHISTGSSHFESVNLNDKLKAVLEDLELVIEEKHADITVGNLPVITANRRQMQQLFQNLLGNALKYSKPGITPKIEITSDIIAGHDVPITLTGEQVNKQYHLVQIKDNGIGFHPEDADKIFNVFTRLHGGEVYKGTGIGLSIARKVAENHKGHIWAEPQPGEGATFKILLPVE